MYVTFSIIILIVHILLHVTMSAIFGNSKRQINVIKLQQQGYLVKSFITIVGYVHKHGLSLASSKFAMEQSILGGRLSD